MVLAACVAIDPDARLCAVGAAECSCTLGGSCDAGLECRASICVDPNAVADSSSGTIDPSSSSSSGAVATTETSDPSVDSGSSGESSGGGSDQPNVVFVTSQLYAGAALGGLDGADALCQSVAESAALTGTYRAWLSDAQTSASSRMGSARGWVRSDGKPFAVDLQQIIEGRAFYPPVTDEHGNPVPIPDYVWTGTGVDGNLLDVDGSLMCSGWTSDTGQGLMGTLGAGLGWWTAYAASNCSFTAHLVCLGVDGDADVALTPTAGRLAFVSSGYVGPSDGRDAADALCASEAAAAGADGSFLALMANTGESPGARMNTAGAPWVRADGVPIFLDGQVFGTTLAAPILYDAEGVPTPLAIAWAGAYGVDQIATDADNCSGWTATSGFAAMFSVIHAYWQGWTIDGHSSAQECQSPYSVICLEQ